MSKLKWGDRIIIDSDGRSTYNSLSFDGVKGTIRSNLEGVSNCSMGSYLILFDEITHHLLWKRINTAYLKLDVRYYREQRLKKILNKI